jgi:hypothetical protein
VLLRSSCSRAVRMVLQLHWCRAQFLRRRCSASENYLKQGPNDGPAGVPSTAAAVLRLIPAHATVQVQFAVSAQAVQCC